MSWTWKLKSDFSCCCNLQFCKDAIFDATNFHTFVGHISSDKQTGAIQAFLFLFRSRVKGWGSGSMRSPLQLWCSSSGNVFENSSPSLAPTSIKNPFFYTLIKKVNLKAFKIVHILSQISLRKSLCSLYVSINLSEFVLFYRYLLCIGNTSRVKPTIRYLCT